MSLLPPEPMPEPEERARLGPKSAEDETPVMGKSRVLTLRAMAPNAITAAALCSGLTGIRFAIADNWPAAVAAIILAGLLDGIDGRIARALNAQSRFGAELDPRSITVSGYMAFERFAEELPVEYGLAESGIPGAAEAVRASQQK